MNDLITESVLLIELRKMAYEAGTQKKLAEMLHVCPDYLSVIFHRRKAPGPSVLKAMGYEKVVLYRRIDNKIESVK